MKAEETNRAGDERRRFLRGAATAAGVLLTGCAASAAVRGSNSKTAPRDGPGDAEVTPGEDLMQEHGVLERILLIYDEVAMRLERGDRVELSTLTAAAGIVKTFVEDYHEKLEEEFVFSRLEAAQREVQLVAVLRRQHQRGREVTADIIRLATGANPAPDLVKAIRAFSRMYRPHAAREDTVLFPAFRSVVGGAAYRELGEQFEDQEHARFGEHGFENAVARVALLETALDIGDLGKFTPS